MNTYFHSVRLDEEKCMGCTNCIKRCPTQAIRVRSGKAHIISERCIDCGECIRVCPHHAKYSHRDSMNRIIEFKYRVALPAPSLYGQFNNLDDIGYVITALKMLGFDEVFEVARGAELVSDATRKYIAEHDIPRPVFYDSVRISYKKATLLLYPFARPLRELFVKAGSFPGFPAQTAGFFVFSRFRTAFFVI